MSLFMLQERNWGGLPTNMQNSRNRQGQPESLLRVERYIQEQMRKHKAYTDISMVKSSQYTRYFILFECNGYSTKGVATLNCNKRTGQISLKIDVLTPQNTYLKLDNRHQAIKICKNLYANATYDRLFSKIAVDMDTKQLKVHIPYLTHSFSNPLEFTYESMRENAIVISFKAFIDIYLPYLEKLLHDLLPLERGKDLTSTEKQLLSGIHKYSEMVVVATRLSQNPIQAEQHAVERQSVQEKSILKLCKGRQAVSPELIKNNQLMCLIPEQSGQPRPVNEYCLVGKERKNAQEKTRMSYQPRFNNPYDNTMLLNNIIIHNPPQIPLTKINEGGFSTIYRGQIPFWYSELPERDRSFNRQQVMDHRRMLIKMCVIKSQQKTKRNRSKNQHEINIIKILKNQSSAYLFKYYLPLNDPNPFPNSVILDATPFPNLGDYLIEHRETISLNSKLLLMFNIIQSLRYLRDFKIVHLDIKPNNIMVHCHMMIKLIDFGESYHPDICQKNHKPGFTPPYSSPQIFQEGNKFTDKSDVFSLGVLVYQMMYGRFPFDLLKDRATMQTQMKSYLKLWYFSPEQYENYGDSTVLRLLNNILSKCLSVNPEQRPQLDWLALIVRLCLDLIH